MLVLPDPKLVDFAGIQRNFEKIGPTLNSLQSQIDAADSLIAAAQGSLTALQSQVNSVQSTANTSATQLAYSTTNSAPTATSRIQLNAYRSMTSTGNAGGTAGSPLTLTDWFVEVNNNAVTNVYVPTAASMPVGKQFVIRNNRPDKKTIAIRNTSSGYLFTAYKTIQVFASLTIVNTGSLWRPIALQTTVSS